MKALVLSGDWAPKHPERLSEEARRKRMGLARECWRNLRRTIEDVPEPKVAPDDVIIQPKVTAICGTDFLRMDKDEDGYPTWWGTLALPTVIGHEVCGIVVEVGKNVKHLRVGDVVTAGVTRYCGRCRNCHLGVFSRCENATILGSTENGVMAEYVAWSARCCWRADALREVYATDEEVFEAAALTEALGTPYYDLFVRGGGFRPGAYLVFYMAGPKYWLQAELGIALAKFAGAAKVIVVDMLDEGTPVRQQVYRAMGADHIIKASEAEAGDVSVEEQIMEFTRGAGGDFYWENANLVDRTMPITERTMALGAKSVHTARLQKPYSVSLDAFRARNGQLIGSEGAVEYGTIGLCLRAMADGVDVRPSITKYYDFDDAVESFRFGHTYRDGHIAIRMPSLEKTAKTASRT